MRLIHRTIHPALDRPLPVFWLRSSNNILYPPEAVGLTVRTVGNGHQDALPMSSLEDSVARRLRSEEALIPRPSSGTR